TAGEKCFVDYCGPTLPIVDPDSGAIRDAQVFVAVLGASNYTYTEATWTQSLPDWLASHARAFRYFGGVPEMVVPDNLRSGVSRACRYDPELNPSYQQLAAHYQVAIVPARPYKPKDKAKAEVGVQIVERWILARLRHHTFFTLAEANRCIHGLLIELNTRPFRQLPGNRKQASKRWRNGHCGRCRNGLIRTSISGAARSTSITTSPTTRTTTRCRINTSANRSKCTPATGWCKSTSGNAGSPVIAERSGPAPRRNRATCPNATASIRNGRPGG